MGATRQRIVCSRVEGEDLITESVFIATAPKLKEIMGALSTLDYAYTSPSYKEGELWVERENFVEDTPIGQTFYFRPGDTYIPMRIIKSLV